MRRVVVLGMLGVLAAAPPTPFQAATGLVGHWPLDEATAAATAVDVVGGYDGTYNGNSTQSLSVPASMVAYPDPASRNFDGNGDYVSVPDTAALRITGDITIAFWMNKASEAGDWQRLVGKGDGSNRNYGVWEESGAGTRILFQMYNAGAPVLDVFSTGNVPLNTWTHVVCRLNGTAAAIFLNNTASGTGTRGGAPSTSADPFTIADAPGLHTFFPGLMDDVRVYNRALTDPEIGLLFNGLPGATAVTAAPAPSELLVSWTAPASGSTGFYTLLRGTSPATLAPYQVVNGTSYLDTGLTPGTTYYYAVIAQLSVGDAAISNTASGVPDNNQPRYNDHEEGGKDRDCACGTLPASTAPWTALLGLAAILGARRRKR
jgi:MYXO-CTERM domain-containing protein